jgi:small-conductance mechanosensitive channel
MGSLPGVQLDRVHFAALGASSLDFEMAFYIESGDYAAYMKIQQEFNLRIYEKCLAEGVAFAFPTQTIHLARPS